MWKALVRWLDQHLDEGDGYRRERMFQEEFFKMARTPKTWIGDKMCNICLKKITHKLYDARVSRGGTWATMCEKCFKQSGAGLGDGRGQEYTQKNHDAPFVKTGG